jgi:hypothetical protein
LPKARPGFRPDTALAGAQKFALAKAR